MQQSTALDFSNPQTISEEEPGMTARLAAFGWSSTVLGPPETWPEALNIAVQILMNSRFPMFIWWGPELINIYNDAYIPILGRKHPDSFGRPAAEIWSEIWDVVGAQAYAVVEQNQATWNEEVLLVMERHGYAEETYFTWSYSPIPGKDGTTAGLFCAVTEDTSKVISRRRMKTLRALASETADLRTAPEVFASAASVLARNPHDLPFVLMYEADAEAAGATLSASVGVGDAERGAPKTIGFESGSNPWKLDLLVNEVQLINNLDQLFDCVPAGPWPLAPKQALVLPFGSRGEGRPSGIMIAGISSYLRVDDDYRGFLALVAGHVATALANSKAYEAERRRAEALAEIDKAKTTFFSNVSHEFRTPLTLMLGPLEDLLATGKNDASSRAHLEVIHRNSLRLLKLVNTLLDFSRIEAGRTQANYEPVDLCTLTAELASTFRSAMERAGLAFTIDCEPLSESAYVDRDMWEKIVLNLLSNAFKYTLHGSVSVSLHQHGRFVKLSVADTGTGIAAHELPHIFERFHRAEGVRGRTYEGTGIGLALVHELVKLHQGKLEVASTAGQGSTFTVEIPLGAHERKQGVVPPAATTLHSDAYVEEAMRWLPDSQQPATSESDFASTQSGDVPITSSRSHILFADDNSDMREYVAGLLGSRYRVTAVGNGSEALAAALADPPDLVLTDVMMPVMDGFQLVSELRARPELKAVPIIMLSARSGEDSLVEGLEAGSDDYLMKPFTARELLARVSAHLALRKERQRAHERLVQVFQQAPVGVVVLRGPEFVVELANPSYEQLLQRGALAGRKFTEVLPELRTDIWDILRTVAATGQPFIGNELHAPFDADHDGAVEDHWFNVNYQPLREDNGSISGLIAVVTEVTAQVLARKELERANQELEEFAFVAGHDLQEPLRMVNIYAQMLLKRPGLEGDAKAAECSAFIQSGVKRMGQLIKDLLAYSRVIHSEPEAPRTADLNAAMNGALDVLRMRVEESDASISYDPLPVVRGDESQLCLVLQNILSNSLKYRLPDTKPVIRVRAEPRDSEYLIRIQDNGLGFEPRHAERIFGLFKRLHKDAYPGTGLGLSICKRIIERCGGRIWAESDGEGRGATISILLKK